MVLCLLDLCEEVMFAVSGTLAAGRKGLDVLGGGVIAAITAVGGGTLLGVNHGGSRAHAHHRGAPEHHDRSRRERAAGLAVARLPTAAGVEVMSTAPHIYRRRATVVCGRPIRRSVRCLF